MSQVFIVVAKTKNDLEKVADAKGYKIIEASKCNFTSLELSTDPVFKDSNLEIYESGWVALAKQI